MASTTTNTFPETRGPVFPGKWQGLSQFFLLLISLWLLYHRIAANLVVQWWTDTDYNYGFFVPVLVALVVWKGSSRRRDLKATPSWWGLVIVLGSLAILTLGVIGAENFLSRFSFVLLLAGLAIQFRGWKFFRSLLFPWAALFLMIPLPAILFNEISLPLQFLASRLGAFLLHLSGVPVVREGNVILLPAMTLDVAEACSGLRSLFSLLTVSVFYSYLFEKNTLRRILLVAFSVPLAIVANGLRITITGLIGQYWGLEKAQGFYHLFSGVLIFLASLVSLVILRRVLALRGHAEQKKALA